MSQAMKPLDPLQLLLNRVEALRACGVLCPAQAAALAHAAETAPLLAEALEALRCCMAIAPVWRTAEGEKRHLARADAALAAWRKGVQS